MSQLTLMRHGQASFAGSRYDELSEAGHAQARATGAWLRGRADSWNAVLHGPRRRHAETATQVLAGAGVDLSPQLAPGLDEFAEGDEILDAAAVMFGRPMMGPEAPARAEQLRCYEAAYLAWARDEIPIVGRASYQDFRLAVRHWLAGVVSDASAPPRQRILAVTSAGVIAAVVCEVMRLPDAQWLALMRVIGNASLSEVLFSNGRCGLRSFNSTAHLPHGLGSAI